MLRRVEWYRSSYVDLFVALVFLVMSITRIFTYGNEWKALKIFFLCAALFSPLHFIGKKFENANREFWMLKKFLPKADPFRSHLKKEDPRMYLGVMLGGCITGPLVLHIQEFYLVFGGLWIFWFLRFLYYREMENEYVSITDLERVKANLKYPQPLNFFVFMFYLVLIILLLAFLMFVLKYVVIVFN